MGSICRSQANGHVGCGWIGCWVNGESGGTTHRVGVNLSRQWSNARARNKAGRVGIGNKYGAAGAWGAKHSARNFWG